MICWRVFRPPSLALNLVLLVLSCTILPASAQLSLEKRDTKDAIPEAPAPLENIEADRAWVNRRLEAATAELAEARAAQARAGESKDSKETELLSALVTIQNYRVIALRQHLDLLSEVEVTRQDLEQLRQEEITGPSQPAGASITYAAALDRWHALVQYRDEDEAEQLRTAMFAKGKQQAMNLLANAGQDYRLALEKLESAKDDDARRLARQNVSAEQAAQAFAQERLAYFEARERAQAERGARNQIRGRLLESGLEQAIRGLKIDESDLASRLESNGRESAEVQSVLATVADEESTLQKVLGQARAAAAVSSGDPANVGARDDELRFLLDRAAALRATTDDIGTIYVVWLNLEQTWWQQRHQFDAAPDTEAVRSLPATLSDSISAAGEARRLLSLTQSDVTRRIAELASTGATPVPSALALRDSLARRLELLQRADKVIQRVSDFLQIWHAELKLEHRESTLALHGKAWLATVSDTAMRLWNYELFAMEDRITVDGEVLVEKRPVTFGKVILAIIVLSVGLIVARGFGRLSGFVLAPLYRRGWGNRLILEKLIRAVTVLLAVVIALVTVKIPLAVFAFLGGALAIGIGFGAQNLINNFISGFILLTERPIRPGDIIELEGIRGKVAAIGERCTRVRRFDGIEILIPNSQLLEQSVTNMTHSDHRMRANLPVGVAYGSPTRKVQSILLQIARDHELVLEEPVPQALFEGLGDSALNFSLYFWVDLFAQPDWRVVASDLLHRICERLAEEKIVIAFPQRDLHLDATRPIPIEMVRPPGASNPLP